MHCHGHLKTGGVESGLDLDQRIHFRARIILHAEFRTMFFLVSDNTSDVALRDEGEDSY